MSTFSIFRAGEAHTTAIYSREAQVRTGVAWLSVATVRFMGVFKSGFYSGLVRLVVYVWARVCYAPCPEIADGEVI